MAWSFKRVILVLLTFLPLLLAIIFLGVGVKVVDYGQYALRYNAVTSRIMDNKHVYNSGRYLVGIESSFINFPSKDQLISVDDIHIVNDMSAYEIGVSAIYSIKKENVYNIYTNYSTFENFEKALTRVLNHTFSTKASVIAYEAYFEKQEATQEALFQFLKEPWAEMGADLNTFFIDYVYYADLIEKKLIAKQIAALNNTLQEVTGNYTDIQVTMNRMQRTNDVLIGEVYANTTATKEYYKTAGKYDVSIEYAKMLTCMYQMLTTDELPEIEDATKEKEKNNASQDSNNSENSQPTTGSINILDAHIYSNNIYDNVSNFNTLLKPNEETDPNNSNDGTGESTETPDDPVDPDNLDDPTPTPDPESTVVSKGINFNDEELIEYMKNRAIFTSKNSDSRKSVIELKNYVPL